MQRLDLPSRRPLRVWAREEAVSHRSLAMYSRLQKVLSWVKQSVPTCDISKWRQPETEERDLKSKLPVIGPLLVFWCLSLESGSMKQVKSDLSSCIHGKLGCLLQRWLVGGPASPGQYLSSVSRLGSRRHQNEAPRTPLSQRWRKKERTRSWYFNHVYRSATPAWEMK